MRATIKFKTDKATDWIIRKDFASKQHLNNFVRSVLRKKDGYSLDEIFEEEVLTTAKKW